MSQVGGRVAGWLDQLEKRLNSGYVEVEVEAELGKIQLLPYVRIQ